MRESDVERMSEFVKDVDTLGEREEGQVLVEVGKDVGSRFLMLRKGVSGPLDGEGSGCASKLAFAGEEVEVDVSLGGLEKKNKGIFGGVAEVGKGGEVGFMDVSVLNVEESDGDGVGGAEAVDEGLETLEDVGDGEVGGHF